MSCEGLRRNAVEMFKSVVFYFVGTFTFTFIVQSVTCHMTSLHFSIAVFHTDTVRSMLIFSMHRILV